MGIAQYHKNIGSNVPALSSTNIAELLKHAPGFPHHHTLNFKLKCFSHLIGAPEEVICVGFQ